jgi:hypothetical protein
VDSIRLPGNAFGTPERQGRQHSVAAAPPGKGSMMENVSLMRLVGIAAVASLAISARTDPAPADPPSPGEQCPALQATTLDNHGHPMWCTHMSDGPNDPVWQYTGVS